MSSTASKMMVAEDSGIEQQGRSSSTFSPPDTALSGESVAEIAPGVHNDHALSPSEKATIDHEIEVFGWLSWLEIPFRTKSTLTGRYLPEATGWSMDAGARGPLTGVGSYVGVALLVLASKNAGCERVTGCDGTTYGLKPSSLLSTATAVVNVMAALLMPLVGAIVDHTPHRRIIGQVTALILVAITGIQISINESNWFVILCLEALGGFTLLVHVATVMAYLPDLTLSEKDFVHYTSSFGLRQYAMQTIFAGLVVAISKFTSQQGDVVGNSLRSSRGASSIAFSFSALLFGYSWVFCFRKRPALRELKPEESLWTIGFTSLYKTSRKVFSESKSLPWLMIALLWSPEAGAGVISSITLTYLQTVLQMNATQIAITLLILLIFGLPGSMISKWVCGWVNPLNSYRLAICSFCLFSSIAAITLNGPEQNGWVYLLASLWGTCLGWIYPSQKVLFCTLTPKGQEFEFMGLFTFFGQILSWLPPLLFTILNEQGIHMRWGFSLIPIFFALAFVCTLAMTDYPAGLVVAEKPVPNSILDIPQGIDVTAAEDASLAPSVIASGTGTASSLTPFVKPQRPMHNPYIKLAADSKDRSTGSNPSQENTTI